MRPVTKLTAGENIVLMDGSTHAIQAVYKPYQDAKAPLSANIGEYCSYCERPVSDEALAVEHVQPKKLTQYKHLEFSWSNFLLACARCNGTDNKGYKDVVLNDIHLPHHNNTFLSIKYGIGGFVQIHPNLASNSDEYSKAKTLIDLVGLDKCPGHPNWKPKDNRWLRRDVVWQLATKYELEYQEEKVTVAQIMDLAISRGFFSIWFTVFENFPEVRKALIDNFPGTAKNCFDADYNPIPRNAAAI